MKTLIEKLNLIQVKLNAPKNMYNSFGKYNYRNLEGILEGLKPLLTETGLIVFISDEIVSVGDRVYIKATSTVSDGKDSIVVHGWAREPLTQKGMNEAQITGSASSYARKYSMNGLFAIDDTVDADGMDNSSGKTKTVAKSKQSQDSGSW